MRPLNSRATEVAKAAAADFAASLTGLDKTFSEIVSDWGRLSAVADGVQNHPGDWNISNNEGQIVTAMTNAMKVGFYQKLIPIVYSAVEAVNLPSSDPADFCQVPGDSSNCPFAPDHVNNRQPYAPGIAAYVYPVNDPTNGYKARFHMTVVGKNPIVYLDHTGALLGNDPFPSALMNDLTSAGYYPGWFFQRFPLTRYVCKPGEFNPNQCVRIH
jgi:hypothetical protein